MMKANSDGFRWLPSYYEALRNLPNKDRLALYDALLDYGFGNEPGDLPPRLHAYFALIVPTLEASVNFERKQRENGRKGGRPRKPSDGENEAKEEPKPKKTENPNKTQTKPKAGKTENLDVDIGIDIDVDVEEKGAAKPPKRPRFVPPTEAEVLDYCREKGYAVDPEAFVAFYASKGWKVGNAPMKDWKMALVTWQKREVAPGVGFGRKQRQTGPVVDADDVDFMFRAAAAANAEVEAAGDG